MARSNQDDFDGYRKWLGISNPKRLPTHYELLAISLDEDDPDVIQAAAEQRRHYVESKRGEGHDDLVTEILYRIDEAESTLLNTALRRDYDRKMDLFEKRRKNRQVDPVTRRSRKYRGGRTVGEDGGIVKTFVGIVAFFSVAFGLMAWFSFRLPWSKSPQVEQAVPAQQQLAVVQPPAQAQPVVQVPKDATAKAKEAIQGEWLCVASEEFGKTIDEENLKKQDRHTTINGNDFTMLRTYGGNRGGYVGKFQIDASNGHFDFEGKTPDGRPTKWTGIYELDGETLKLCYWDRNLDTVVRPTNFKTPCVFHTYKRTGQHNLTTQLPKPVLQLTFDGDQTPGVHPELHGAKYVDGKVGIALEFDGSSFAVVNHNLPIGNSPRSLAVWLKNTRGPVDDQMFHVVTQGHKPGVSFGIMEAAGRWRFFDFNGGLDSERRVDTEWHHHCITFDGTTIAYFIDGKPVSDIKRPLNTSVSPLVLGTFANDEDSGKRYQGLIDELMFFDVPLTQDQIRELVKAPSKSVSQEDATVKAMKALQGKWAMQSLNHDGKWIDEKTLKAEDRLLTIVGDNFTFMRSKDGERGGFTGKIQMYSNGKIDLVGKSSAGNHIEWPGIFEVSGDTLKLHFWKSLSEGRPTDFVPIKGNLETYVRHDTTAKASEKLQGEKRNDEDARWKFWDVFRSGAKLDHAIIVSRDGVLVSSGQTKGVCLASLQKFSDCNLKLEFQFSSNEVQGNPYVGIASSLPNPEATEWTKQIPKGIEIKLNPNAVGQLVLPTEDFKAELKPEQSRDAKDKRKISPVRKSELKFGDWNSLEINSDNDRNVTVTINGTVVNQLGAAQSVTGHLTIWTANSEMRVRNVVVRTGGAETKLSFNNIK